MLQKLFRGKFDTLLRCRARASLPAMGEGGGRGRCMLSAQCTAGDNGRAGGGGRRRKEEEEEEEEGLFKANAVSEEDSERDRATLV